MERYTALAQNLRDNVASEIDDGQAEAAKDDFCEDVTEQEIAAGAVA